MLPTVFKTCVPREEILAGELSLDLFAAKLRLVVEGKAPHVYQDATTFFANTFATDGLKTLIAEVFGRLVGVSVGSPIIRLETSFGGGKTHDEIALWHIARNGRGISGLERFADLNLIPSSPIQVAALACQDLDPINGVYHGDSGITTYTLWGEIGYQIGGIAVICESYSSTMARYKKVWIPLIHPHHIPVGVEEEITSDLTSRLQRPLMRIPIGADIYNWDGREAHAQLQDGEWTAAGKPPFSTWVARTIFLHSINQGVVAGIRRAELNLSLLTPGLEIGFVETALERLSTVAWYLENDVITSIARFKEEPSIKKIIKALKDCQKIRSEDEAFYAPAYILQKVWLAGLDHWTTKNLREAFSKDLSLNILLDADVSKLRDSIRQGLQMGQWDMKVGDKVFIKSDDGKFTLPDTIEFSERMVLYRRGILQLPKPREIELNAQVMPSTDALKPVRIRWKASGALTIRLYQDGNLIPGEFRPSDEHEVAINSTSNFKIVADYGNGEVAEKETQARILTYGDGTPATPGGKEKTDDSWNDLSLFKAKPEEFNLDGSLERVFNELSDTIEDGCQGHRILDHKVQSVRSLEISVSQVMDYRKLMTALVLFGKLPLQIDQTATINAGEQFVRLEYQGALKGFRSFQATLNALLNTPEVKADVSLKLEFKFSSPIEPNGSEISNIKSALNRNPVERLNLLVKVTY